MENYFKCFQEDIQEKKMAARRTHKHTRSVVLYSDYLRGKELKNYQTVGGVNQFNMYEDIQSIPSYESLKEMEKEEKRELLVVLRRLHGSKALAEQWGVRPSTVHSMAYILGVTQKAPQRTHPRTPLKKGMVDVNEKPKTVEKADNHNVEMLMGKIATIENQLVLLLEREKNNVTGLAYRKQASMSGKELNDLLAKLQLLFDKSPGQYSVSISIVEEEQK